MAPVQPLRKRAEFLRAARALRHGTAGFLLQARPRAASEPAEGVRLGLTCSRKVGNAVVRNRARRRLRALALAILPSAGRPGWDYVLVGKADATVSRDFAALRDDLAGALARVHRAADRAAHPPAERPSRTASSPDPSTGASPPSGALSRGSDPPDPPAADRPSAAVPSAAVPATGAHRRRP